MKTEPSGQNERPEDQPQLSLVVAMSSNSVIGRDNQLPWRLPKDLAYFKRVTMGHPIVMGRKTYESIGRALPGRQNIVVTRQPDWQAPSVDAVHSLPQALALASSSASAAGVNHIMLIGGAQLFAQALPQAQRLYLTWVHAEVPGDTFFPQVDFGQWREVQREDCFADANNPFDYSFVVYDRAK